MTLMPAYHRDYKSMETVMRDFNAEKDFLAYDPAVGRKRPINRQQLRGEVVTIRYDQTRKVILVTVPEEGDAYVS